MRRFNHTNYDWATEKAAVIASFVKVRLADKNAPADEIRMRIDSGIERESIIRLRDAVRSLLPGKSVRTCCDDDDCDATEGWMRIEL